MAFNKREIRVDNATKPSKPKDVIYDPMGQWKYPGQVTKIPSGDITMQGINYPVLGVDNLGNEQMMYPNMDYQFPGDSVTEYPQLDEMRKGGLPRKNRQTNKNIQSSINDLMRKNYDLFGPLGRHYYKPKLEKGGWLDQYQDGGNPYTLSQSYIPYNPSETVNKPEFKVPVKPVTEEQMRQAEIKQAMSKPRPVIKADTRPEQIKKQDQALADKIQRESDNPWLYNPAGQILSYVSDFQGMTPEDAAYINTSGFVDRMGWAADKTTGALANELVGAGLVKGSKYVNNFIKASKDSGILSNAHELNPWAYQYNLPENTMWRGIGESGMKDALKTGMFRAKPNVDVVKFPGTDITASKQFNKAFYSPEFKAANSYGEGFIAEVPKSSSEWAQRYKRNDWSQFAKRDIAIDEGRILKKDWWQGYKPIDVPKELPGINQYKKSGWLDNI